MIYVYIKPEVKKNDTTAMTAAINEACIWRLHENCYLVREIFLVREMSNILLLGRILSPSTNDKVSPKRFWERGRAVNTWWRQQSRLKERKILVKIGIQGV